MAAGTFLPITPHSASIFERGTLLVEEAASQTFKKGAPLIINASGFVEEAAAAPASVKYIAAEDGHNTSSAGDKSVLVYQVMASDIWEATAEDALAQTDIGANYGLVKDSTTKFWYVDSAATGDQVSVVDFVKRDGLGEIGDTKARILVKFDQANIAGY